MEFELEGRSVLRLKHNEGETTSSHVSTNFNLQVSENLNKADYFNEEELPNKNGVKCLTQTFVQGLVGNIHYANEKGYWDDAQHLRYIIAELEKGFMAHPTIYDSNFTS